MGRVLAMFAVVTVLLAVSPLPAPAASDAPLGQLGWGLTDAGESWTPSLVQARLDLPADDVGAATTAVLKRAQETIQQPVLAVPSFHQQAVLFTQPEYQASHAAAAQLDQVVYPWAMCARVAAEPLASSCRARAAEAIQSWVGTYKPTGAPVDEANLIPLFQSIDLMLPVLAADQRNATQSWVTAVIQQNDAYYQAVPAKSASKTNNHASWGFSLRAIETALGGSYQQAASKQLLAQQIANNIKPDGSTLDFAQRDALHYQAYDLEALTDALLLAPGAVDADGEAAILRGIQFLQPYVTGQQQHIEFLSSKVPFDAQRRDAGNATFANAPWRPSDAGRLLLLAQARFPAVRSWAAPSAQSETNLRLRQIAALQHVLG